MSKTEHEKFWMVWSPSGRPPTYKHSSRYAAELEAERLAKKNPEHSFFILKAVGGFVAPSPSPKQIKLRPPNDLEIPF